MSAKEIEFICQRNGKKFTCRGRNWEKIEGMPRILDKERKKFLKSRHCGWVSSVGLLIG